MGRRKTHEEFVDEIKNKFDGNIIVLGNYIDKKTKIKFQCLKCDNIWDTAPMSILNTSVGCPLCANEVISQKLIAKNIEITGKFIDLYPDLARRVDYDKTKDVCIESLSAHSGKYIWWKCDICSHSWRGKVANMVKNKGNCPKCYHANMTNNVITYRLNRDGSLADHYPDLLAEWDYDKNINLDPNNLLVKSNKTVWWKCQKCGREWQAKIANRANGNGCPYCYGRYVLSGYNDLRRSIAF